MDKSPIFSLSLETLMSLPGSVTMEDKAVIIDNTFTPFITHATDAWKNTPVLVDEILVIFCTEGEANVRISFEDYKLTENSVCILTPSSVIEVLSVSPKFHCLILAFDQNFVSLDQSTTLELIQLFKYFQRQPCYPLSGMYAIRYRETFIDAVKTARWQDNPLRINMMQSYIYLLFCCLYPVLVEKDKERNTDNITNHRRVYFQFMELVQANYREHRTIAYYASRLNLSAKYLSKIIQEESGQSALKWIDNYVILESKALLKQVNIPIKEIAKRMNFPDQSSFGKFFLRVMGVSPKEYRDKE